MPMTRSVETGQRPDSKRETDVDIGNHVRKARFEWHHHATQSLALGNRPGSANQRHSRTLSQLRATNEVHLAIVFVRDRIVLTRSATTATSECKVTAKWYTPAQLLGKDVLN